MEIKELETWLQVSNAVRVGELQRSFDAFMNECTRWLSQGYRVQTPIGVFSLNYVYPTRMFNPFAKCVKCVGEKRDSVARSVEEGPL